MAGSALTQRAIEQAQAAARSDLPVWVRGAAGAGKAYLGRAIHAWSARAQGPLVDRSCGALPEPLQAREIFGCAAGVHSQIPGAYEGGLAKADGGTVLLANVDRLRKEVRRQLGQAMADGFFSREGDSVRTPLRARVIATTANSESPFGDLPHHAIELPALLDRSEDILPLAAHFLSTFAAEEGVKPVGFTEEARAALLGEAWPGNVRELRERIRQAVRLAGDGAITAEALLLAGEGSQVPSFKEAKRAFERRYVTGLLRRCHGNISRAARLAKKDRKDFYDVIRRTGVDPSEFRQ